MNKTKQNQRFCRAAKNKKFFSVFIRTFGCSANQSDSEVMAGLLAEAGYQIMKPIEDSDIVIINSCGVKQRSEINFFRELDRARRLKKRIIAAGCIPSGNKDLLQTKLKDVSVVDLNSIKNIAYAVEQTLKGKRVILLGEKKTEKICLSRIRKNKIIAIVPIAEGCIGSCSYCFTKLAKGELFSYAEESILREIKIALKEGCKEVWLTSQDCAAYGLDRGTNLAELLKKICTIKKDFLIRIGMMNPNNILKILDNLVSVYKNKKIFKFLHIPVQSGNNRTLKLMNRNYGAEGFKKIILKFKREIQNITISTDIICGFPSETEKEFQDSVRLIKWLKPDVLNLNMFWPRPNTPAVRMKQQKPGIAKARTRELTKIFDKISLDKNKKWIGKQTEVLMDEIGSRGGFVGRTRGYKAVVVKVEKLELGDFVKVKIISATKDYLIGEVVRH